MHLCSPGGGGSWWFSSLLCRSLSFLCARTWVWGFTVSTVKWWGGYVTFHVHEKITSQIYPSGSPRSEGVETFLRLFLFYFHIHKAYSILAVQYLPCCQVAFSCCHGDSSRQLAVFPATSIPGREQEQHWRGSSSTLGGYVTPLGPQVNPLIPTATGLTLLHQSYVTLDIAVCSIK